MVVDITADQFEEISESVIVCKCEESEWHKNFIDKQITELSFPFGNLSPKVYEKIVAQLKVIEDT